LRQNQTFSNLFLSSARTDLELNPNFKTKSIGFSRLNPKFARCVWDFWDFNRPNSMGFQPAELNFLEKPWVEQAKLRMFNPNFLILFLGLKIKLKDLPQILEK